MRFVQGTLLVVFSIAGLLLFSACGGGSEPKPEGEAAFSFSEIVGAKLATALGLDGVLWEKEDTSAWKDAQLFANRIMGEVEVPALDDMEISVLKDEATGDGRTVLARVRVADLTAEYRITMREVGGQWRVTNYVAEDIVEAVGR